MIRVAVMGALGRMGTEVMKAVSEDSEIQLVCGVDPKAEGVEKVEIVGSNIPVFNSKEKITTELPTPPDVIVDFTLADAAIQNINWALENRIHAVVGTTGIPEEQISLIRKEAEEKGCNILIAANFAIGAVLMMKFAEMASRVFDQCEIVELHHRGKIDAPSGTAIATAKRIISSIDQSSNVSLDGSRGGLIGGVRIHSVRLDGLVAHQEVIFGGKGQTLIIRHDTTDRSCFMPGVLMAIKAIKNLPGLTIGLEPILGI